MTEASSAPGAGIPCWMDLLTSDAARAREFYGQIFGWQALEPSPEFGGYFMFTLDGAPAAGGMPILPEMAATDVDMTDGWGVYLASPDAKASIERVVAHGGKVRMPPMEVADLGTQAIIEDPGGARIGIWQPGVFPGFGAIGTGKPGAPAWFELHARDHAGAVAFYRAALGWDPKVVGDTDAFRLTAVEDDGQPVAGIMDACAYLPEGQAPHWDAYISVADADETLALAGELGGAVLQEPMDTPFGRLAALADPMGARIKVVARTAG
jgi:predicted enzyme related to lactoylglutathione lyase